VQVPGLRVHAYAQGNKIVDGREDREKEREKEKKRKEKEGKKKEKVTSHLAYHYYVQLMFPL
jgi:hypothetical protein